MRLLPAVAPLLVLLVASIGQAADQGKNAAPLRVASFNVRNSNAKDGDDAWPKRTELFFDTIKALAPDLIGFQEVLADQHDAIIERMADFGFAGVARDDGKRKGEW